MKKLILGALMMTLLAACASKQVQEEPKKVEEKPAAEAPRSEEKPMAQPAIEKPASAPKKAEVSMPAERSVHYDFDKSAIKDEYKSVIQNNANYLNDHDSAKVTIEGNCDERGSREYNLALGQRRADSVRKALGVMGVSESRIDTISFGEEKARCADHNEACWSQNRRSDIKY